MTSLGPNGRKKILVTSAGQVRVTSTSDRIFSTISTEILSDPFAEAVGHIVKGHLATWGDFGLTAGILLCDLVKIFSDNYDPAAMLSVRNALNKSMKEVFGRSRIRVDVANLDQVLSLLKTVLNSKPTVKSGRTSKSDKDFFLKKVSAKILEGFLKTIPESGYVRFDLGLIVKTGNQIDPEIRDGFFHPLPDLPVETETVFKRLSSGEKVKILVMNVQLKSDFSELSEMSADVTIGRNFSTRHVEKQFFEHRLNKLAEFCRQNEGEGLKYLKALSHGTEVALALSNLPSQVRTLYLTEGKKTTSPKQD